MKWRRPYLAANAFELMLAWFAIAATIAFLLDPKTLRQTAVGSKLAPYDTIWITGYGVAGVLIVIGLLLPTARAEIAGLSLLVAAVAINAVAVFALAGSTALFPITNYAALIAASVVRMGTIVSATRKK